MEVEKLGTRSEIRIGNNGNAEVTLYKHWDGYPEAMIPMFKDFRKFADECVGTQKHWLSYPEDVAAMLIAFDYELQKKRKRTAKKEYKDYIYTRPDIRPMGQMDDFVEYVYDLDLGDSESRGKKWTLKIHEVHYDWQRDFTQESPRESRTTKIIETIKL